MEKFVALLASGIALGGVSAIVALGFLVLYKATGVVNFATGDIVTLGAYLAFWSIDDLGLPVVPGYVLALALVAIVGLLFELVIFRPLHGQSLDVLLVATLGAAVVIRAALALWQGSDSKRLPTPVGDGAVFIAGAAVPYQRILAVLVALAALALCVWVFQGTQLGRQVRALAADAEAATLQGIRVKRVSKIAFASSAVLAGLGGILIAPSSTVNLTFGFSIMLTAFAAAIMGGFGSLIGTAVAAVALGVVQQVGGGYLFPDYADQLPFIAMLIAIVARPKGLAGATRKARV
jgi:branched-chain amino acid transport system permease protein